MRARFLGLREGDKDIPDEIDHRYPISIMLTWRNPVVPQGCKDSRHHT
jgi:hypothetical protein